MCNPGTVSSSGKMNWLVYVNIKNKPHQLSNHVEFVQCKKFETPHTRGQISNDKPINPSSFIQIRVACGCVCNRTMNNILAFIVWLTRRSASHSSINPWISGDNIKCFGIWDNRAKSSGVTIQFHWITTWRERVKHISLLSIHVAVLTEIWLNGKKILSTKVGLQFLIIAKYD